MKLSDPLAAVGQAAAWRFIPRMSGGGVLLDVGSHRLDLLSWWFGLPRRLVARTETLTHDYPVEDSAAVLMILAGGAHFTGTFNWNSRVRGDEIQIIGTEAQMTLLPCDGPEVVIAAGSNVERRDMPKPSNLHYPLVDDFARAMREIADIVGGRGLDIFARLGSLHEAKHLLG